MVTRATFLRVIGMTAAVVALAHPAIGSVYTTEGTFQAENAFLPAEGPPLLGIDTLRSNSGGVFTNQYTGIAGVAGLIRTVAALPINVMVDGTTYGSVVGPSSVPGAETMLVFFAGLEGNFTGPGSINLPTVASWFMKFRLTSIPGIPRRGVLEQAPYWPSLGWRTRITCLQVQSAQVLRRQGRGQLTAVSSMG
jgi:hypothetical protein